MRRKKRGKVRGRKRGNEMRANRGGMKEEEGGKLMRKNRRRKAERRGEGSWGQPEVSIAGKIN